MHARVLQLLPIAVLAGSIAAQSKLFTWSEASSSNTTARVRGVPDLDGDGCDDLLTSRPWATVAGKSYAGEVTVRSGRTGATIRTHAGEFTNDSCGSGIAGIGDVDGDALGDYAIGFPQIIDPQSPQSAASGYVRVYSGATGAVIWQRDGAGVQQQRYGIALANPGDWDHDGWPDLIIAGTGLWWPIAIPCAVHIRSGRTGAMIAALPMCTSNGWSDAAVSGTGDLDGDGELDAIVSDRHRGYSVYGGLAPVLKYEWYPVHCGYASCQGTTHHNANSLAWAGDLNGDGHQDYAVGSTWENQSAQAFGGTLDIRSGVNHATLPALQPWTTTPHEFGYAVAGLGDVDSDGFGDLLVTASGVSSYAYPTTLGELGVYRGGSYALLFELDQSNGLPAHMMAGDDVTLAGDLNGDGHADFAAATATDGFSAFSTTSLALTTSKHELGAAAGGTASFALTVPSHPTQLYFLLGSASGTTPGIAIDGVLVPLNPDAYTFALLQAPNQPPFQGTLGVLDASGKAQAGITLPPGVATALVGLSVQHAFVVFSGAVVAASNAVPLSIVP